MQKIYKIGFMNDTWYYTFPCQNIALTHSKVTAFALGQLFNSKISCLPRGWSYSRKDPLSILLPVFSSSSFMISLLNCSNKDFLFTWIALPSRCRSLFHPRLPPAPPAAAPLELGLLGLFWKQLVRARHVKLHRTYRLLVEFFGFTLLDPACWLELEVACAFVLLFL